MTLVEVVRHGRRTTWASVAGWVNNSMGKVPITCPIGVTVGRCRSRVHGRVQGKNCSRLFSLQWQVVRPCLEYEGSHEAMVQE